MKKFKSFIAVLLCLAAVFCTAGCSASKKSALNISGAQIDYETFLYYFDQVHAFPEKYELAADATNEQMIDAAIELCCEYVAVNTKLSEYGLTLSASEKRSASNNLEDLWHVFSGYYEKLGVSKQTLMKIETADTSRNRLFYYIYDEGGEKAVSEDDIKKYYNENYISFRAITGYLTTTDANGDTVVMTADQKAAMNKEFIELSTRLGNGQTMNEIVELYSKKHPDSTVSDQLQFITVHLAICLLNCMPASQITGHARFYQYLKRFFLDRSADDCLTVMFYHLLRKYQIVRILFSIDMENLVLVRVNNHQKRTLLKSRRYQSVDLLCL